MYCLLRWHLVCILSRRLYRFYYFIARVFLDIHAERWMSKVLPVSFPNHFYDAIRGLNAFPKMKFAEKKVNNNVIVKECMRNKEVILCRNTRVIRNSVWLGWFLCVPPLTVNWVWADCNELSDLQREQAAVRSYGALYLDCLQWWLASNRQSWGY